jgi:hypothetical protein
MWLYGIELITGIQTIGAWKDCHSNYANSWCFALLSAVGNNTTGQFFNAASQAEITGTNYAAQGSEFNNATSYNENGATMTAANSICDFTCAQNETYPTPQWSTNKAGALTETTAAFGEVIAATGTASTTPVLCSFDFGGTYQCTAGTFTITFGTDATTSVAHSVFEITVS